VRIPFAETRRAWISVSDRWNGMQRIEEKEGEKGDKGERGSVDVSRGEKVCDASTAKGDQNEERTSLFSFPKHSISSNDLSRHVPVPVDDEGGKVAIGVVLDALTSNDGDEFGSREALGEGGEDFGEAKGGRLTGRVDRREGCR